MRVVLAIVSFVLGTVCLSYIGLLAFSLSQEVDPSEILEMQGEIAVAMVVLGISFIVGVAFVVAGILLLGQKPRRER